MLTWKRQNPSFHLSSQFLQANAWGPITRGLLLLLLCPVTRALFSAVFCSHHIRFIHLSFFPKWCCQQDVLGSVAQRENYWKCGKYSWRLQYSLWAYVGGFLTLVRYRISYLPLPPHISDSFFFMDLPLKPEASENCSFETEFGRLCWLKQYWLYILRRSGG